MTVRENERNRLVTAVDFAAHCGSNNRHSFLYRRNYCLVGGTAAEPKPEDFADAVITLPMVLPPTVAGFFYCIFGNNRFWASLFIS